MCGRCEDLEGKVIYLESELGLRLEAAELASLARVLGLTAQLAKFALFLYRARGIPTTEQLHDMRGLIAHIAGILAHRDADGGTQTAEMLRRIADRLSGPSRRVA